MDWVQFSIRLPKEEHAALSRCSEDERRSLNGQASKLLAEALAQLGYLPRQRRSTDELENARVR